MQEDGPYYIDFLPAFCLDQDYPANARVDDTSPLKGEITMPTNNTLITNVLLDLQKRYTKSTLSVETEPREEYALTPPSEYSVDPTIKVWKCITEESTYYVCAQDPVNSSLDIIEENNLGSLKAVILTLIGML